MSDDAPTLDARIVELTPQPTVAVRVSQPMSELDLSALFDVHLPNIAHRVADVGGMPAGPPYGRYHQFGPETVDVEIGFPVASPVGSLRPLEECEPGEVGASELPGGRAAVTVLIGSYAGLGAAYDRLHEWIHGQSLEEGVAPWESYADDPSEVGEEKLRTEVVWPLA